MCEFVDTVNVCAGVYNELDIDYSYSVDTVLEEHTNPARSVVVVAPAPFCCAALAKPVSERYAISLSSSRTLAGLKSRCTMLGLLAPTSAALTEKSKSAATLQVESKKG